MDTSSFRDSQYYRSLSRVDKLWSDLSTAIHSCEPGEEMLDCMRTPPWESNNTKIVAAWNALTEPENYDDLVERTKIDMNPTARAFTERALEECRRKQK